MKKINKIVFALCLLLILPLYVKADYTVEVKCKKTDGSTCGVDSQSKYKIKVGEKVTLSYTINSDNVGGFQANLNSSSSSIISGPSDFEYGAFWDGTSGYENNKVILSNNRGTGAPTFSFSITGKSVGTANVTLSNIRIIDNSGDDHKITENMVANFVVEEAPTNTNTNTNTNANTNTNKDTNTNANTNTNKDTNTNANTNTNKDTNTNTNTNTSQKTTSDKTTNPKTGVSFPIISCMVLIAGSVLFIVLRKKNYFNKI